MNVTLTQILNLVGELDDTPGTESPRERFRKFLRDNVTEVGQLRDYVQECLNKAGPQYCRALQDLTNFIATFLDFEVTYGRYQGLQGQIGHDGLWKSSQDLFVVAEVKTTDAYVIRTSTLIGYINDLISERQIPDIEKALGLYIVGRPDAELHQLEHAIIAEKRTQQLRIISIDALLSLAELKTQYDLDHTDILNILRPSGPKVDAVVDLIAGIVAEPRTQPAEEIETRTNETPQKQPIANGEPACWLTSVQTMDEKTAQEWIEDLVGRRKFYAFSQKASGRKHMKAGDRIAFYAANTGVMAHATLTDKPEKKKRPDGTIEAEYPWVCTLKDTKLYVATPVTIDATLRQQLDAFKGKDPQTPWAWFVQATHRVSEMDFAILTGKGRLAKLNS
jgi:hypothetical protein